jgi:DNA relaxase NicK
MLKNDSERLPDEERKAANERFKEWAPQAPGVTFNANLEGLEPLADKLNETQKKILEVIITDFSGENECEAEKDVFKKLRNACARAGMLEKKADQVTFFKTLADPQFMGIVKAVGQGLIGLHIVPITAKCIQMALEGDKTCMRWAFEMTGMMQDKYSFYKDRWQFTHTDVNIGEINFDGKTDAELKEIVGQFSEVVD